MKNLLLTFSLTSLFFTTTFALDTTLLSPPCLPSYHSLFFSEQFELNTSPLATDMPIDCLIGYIGNDSLCKYKLSDVLINGIRNQTWNDTIRKSLRYIYAMSDYDPVRFENFKETGVIGRYKSPRDEAINHILKRVREGLSPNPFLDFMLVNTSIIAHIKVTNVVNAYDPRAAWAKSGKIVSSTILDPIKGKYIPSCVSLFPSSELNNTQTPQNTLKQISDSGSCLQYEYATEWLGIHGGENDYLNRDKIDTLLEAKAEREFIVFLEVRSICNQNYIDYYTLYPCRDNSRFRYVSIYPVINGQVSFIEDFGYGTSLSVGEFKARLRNRINEIKNF
ncbi:MAG: hypothetical protein IPP65_07500 [Chlorobi bacterium]|nr:hypothetical protein [Chlorobiota bacterium]